jgi:hypothetical protein
MKERPDSEDRSWMWQPPLLGDGANQFAGGRVAAFSRRTFSPTIERSRFGGILVGIAMNNNRERDQWLQDVEARQRNVVFPNAVQNEARFWRNLSKQPFTTSTKVGVGILGVFVYGFLITILVAAFRAGVGWRLAVGMILFCGPLFGGIAWATRRNLRNIENARHHPHGRKH